MKTNLLNIETIREYLINKKVYWTNHCLNRLNQRDILVSDVKKAISNGEILEYYHDDYPYSSCLILGYTENNNKLHVVCGINEDDLYMITAYYPNSNKWEKDMRTRRKE